MKSYEDVLDDFFGDEHWVERDGSFLYGHAKLNGNPLAICGTCDEAYIGVELAFRLAGFVLDVVRKTPGRPIVMLVDNRGHRLSLRDELLGNNGYLAHLGECMGFARFSGHRVISVIYRSAVSGGFLAAGLSAESCYALEGSELHVMKLSAMSRITRLPLARLEALCKDSPIFAPGVENFVAMGAVEEIWTDDFAARLSAALEGEGSDFRSGKNTPEERGGRRLAATIRSRVLAGT